MITKVEVMPETQGEQPFVIADSSLGRAEGSRMPEEGLPAFDANVEASQAMEADEIQNYDRFNESTAWPLVVSYCFDTFAESRRFAAELQSKVPRIGTVKYTIDQQTFFLVGAKLRPIRPVLDNGCTIKYEFTISGGLLLNTLPAATP
jgi:hypothetical protein